MAYRRAGFARHIKPPEGSQLNWANPISKNLIGRWLLNEHGGANKAFNIGRDMGRTPPHSRIGGVTTVPGPFGAPAVQFDGTTGLLNMVDGSGNSIAYVSSPPFTFMAWACQTDATKDLNIMAVADEAANLEAHVLSILGTTNTFRFLTRDAGTTAFALSTETAVTGRWYQVTGVLNSDSDRKVYVNGHLAGSDTTATAVTAANIDNLTFGAFKRLATTYGTGRLDNISVWNRSLTANEILWLYNNPFGDILVPKRRISAPVPPPGNGNGRMFLTF